MPDNCLSYALCMQVRTAMLFQKIKSKVSSIELEGHEGIVGIFINRSNVMEQTGQEPCLRAKFPAGELLSCNRHSC